MNFSLPMVMLGLFLLGVGAGTSDAATNRFSFPLGIAIALVGLLVLFFSEEQHRNPAWLKRQVKIIRNSWPIGS